MCFLPGKKDWGLKACYPDEDGGREPHRPAGSHPGRKGPVRPDHKSNRRKDQGQATRGAFWQPSEQDQD